MLTGQHKSILPNLWTKPVRIQVNLAKEKTVNIRKKQLFQKNAFKTLFVEYVLYEESS